MPYEKTLDGKLRELVPVDVSLADLENQKLSLESTIAARQELVEISKAELAEIEAKIAECQKLGIVKEVVEEAKEAANSIIE